MPNPFSKGWKYLMSSFDQKIDENADPLVQIKQASDAAKQQHAQIAEQAAAVIGNKKQLEMKLNRLLEDQKKIQDRARQALQLADKAAAEGDEQKAQEYNNVAEVVASQLVSAEQELEETKALHAQATAQAEEAQRAVQQSEARLKEQLAQVDQLSSQVKQTKMQEASAQAMTGITSVDPDQEVPTLDQVREKIERRYANALGAQELSKDSFGSRMDEIDSAGADLKATSRLDEIRAQMAAEKAELESPKAGELEAGAEGQAEKPAAADVEEQAVDVEKQEAEAEKLAADVEEQAVDVEKQDADAEGQAEKPIAEDEEKA